MRIRRKLGVAAVALFLALIARRATGQALPPVIKGDLGLKSGSQAPPGLYLTALFNYYDPDEVVRNDGTSFRIPTLNQYLLGSAITWVPGFRLLGANYAATVAPAGLNIAIATPLQERGTGWGFGDLYVQPIQLGWHFARADVVAGYGFFAPTGRYTAGASNNTGLGMWSHELTLGATVYFDAAKTWHFATTGAFQIQSKVKDTDQRVGDTLTLEGGFGRAILKGYGNVGVAYYANLKVTEDENYTLPPGFQGKHRYFGIGPEIDLPIPVPGVPLFATFRYLFETGNRIALEGNTLMFLLTFAMPKGH